MVSPLECAYYSKQGAEPGVAAPHLAHQGAAGLPAARLLPRNSSKAVENTS
jgi:hypothetical protein